MSDIHLAVPCFNEERRIDGTYWAEMLDRLPNLHLILVDDGSTDSTRTLLKQLSRELPRTEAIVLPRNVGKANAVRLGMGTAGHHSRPPTFTGYLDCDGAYPPDLVVGIIENAIDRWGGAPGVWAVFPQRPTREVSRGRSRQVMGALVRGYLSFGTPWPTEFDWQAGFKLYRVDTELMAALERPFVTRWFPDVEILCRLGGLAQIEQPFAAGVVHVGDSTVTSRTIGSVARDLVVVKAIQLKNLPLS
jgi:dolichyl-phosphate beta-glucosyltransferase